MRSFQTACVLLPQIAPLGTETQAIADLVTHTSLEIDTTHLQEKRVSLVAIEAVVLGVPGNLLWWVELAVARTATSPLFWSAINGGGGALDGAAWAAPTAPLAPNVIVGTGVHLARHNDFIAWTAHSQFARVVVQTPVAAALPAAFWAVQVLFEGVGT